MEPMTTMMSVMSQFLRSTMMFGFPPAYMLSASPPVTAIPPPPAPLMYPYMGAPFPGRTPNNCYLTGRNNHCDTFINHPFNQHRRGWWWRQLTLLLYLHWFSYSRHMLHLLYCQSLLSLILNQGNVWATTAVVDMLGHHWNWHTSQNLHRLGYKCSCLSSIKHLWVWQYSCVMYTSWPSHINIHEAILMVHQCLQHDRMKSFLFVGQSWGGIIGMC